ncbi:hypothetical protein Hanom_Chr05g00388451 [Helianthus anomalus]
MVTGLMRSGGCSTRNFHVWWWWKGGGGRPVQPVSYMRFSRAVIINQHCLWMVIRIRHTIMLIILTLSRVVVVEVSPALSCQSFLPSFFGSRRTQPH